MFSGEGPLWLRQTELWRDRMNESQISPSLVGRSLVLAYGFISYLIGVAGLVCIIAALATLVPFGFLATPTQSPSLLIDLVLVTLWGAIHTLMARQTFKDHVTRFIPEPAERATYVLIAGMTSILLIGLWQPLPGVIWSFEDRAITLFSWTIFSFGWLYPLAATFAIDHFDLFGLRQVYLYYSNRPRPPIAFVKRYMYRFTRHPIQAGVLIGVWVTPRMMATQLLLSVGFTVYIFIGLWFEEKDLVREIGAPYLQYRKEAGMLLPRISRGA